ncbi:MAG TPA: gephyrin-like molybdotransferase Glp [Candidatus Acidoferrales bacterium]|nr:gephyrin-like molybdotransferase Glp [Candidatus Acidoferrales bacterium]
MRDSAAVLPPTAPFVAQALLAPKQAAIAFLTRVAPPEPPIEQVTLDEAAGRILACDAVAQEDHPAHARSTMDGFAVASYGAGATRRVVGEILMGHAPERGIEPGEALRIPTGGALPDGADAVVPIEEVDEEVGDAGESITLRTTVRAGDAITKAASDVIRGERVLLRGRRIGAPELGVLATLGFAQVPVYRSPVFGIISTGDELVDPTQAPQRGQVRDSNRYAIAGALRAMGATPRQLPRVADTAQALHEMLAAALASCDGVVLTGGSSVGARDLVPRVVGLLGQPGVIVHGIRVKPGKPTMLAAVGERPVIGLPGNPTSALMILETVVRPIIAAYVGERLGEAQTLTGVAQEPIVGREGWTWYVPVVVRAHEGRLLVRGLALHSAHTSLLARANGYAIVGETPWRIEPGELLTVHRFSSGGAVIE